jgi:hypothetical protein
MWPRDGLTEMPDRPSLTPVEDIQQAVKKAEERHATIAYPPTQQSRKK